MSKKESKQADSPKSVRIDLNQTTIKYDRPQSIILFTQKRAAFG
jgi:hypothetical protein